LHTFDFPLSVNGGSYGSPDNGGAVLAFFVFVVDSFLVPPELFALAFALLASSCASTGDATSISMPPASEDVESPA